jgi:hypothetical protein
MLIIAQLESARIIRVFLAYMVDFDFSDDRGALSLAQFIPDCQPSQTTISAAAVCQ